MPTAFMCISADPALRVERRGSPLFHLPLALPPNRALTPPVELPLLLEPTPPTPPHPPWNQGPCSTPASTRPSVRGRWQFHRGVKGSGGEGQRLRFRGGRWFRNVCLFLLFKRRFWSWPGGRRGRPRPLVPGGQGRVGLVGGRW